MDELIDSDSIKYADEDFNREITLKEKQINNTEHERDLPKIRGERLKKFKTKLEAFYKDKISSLLNT